MEQEEKKFTIHRGVEKDEKSREEVRDFIQRMLERSVNTSTLVGSGASYPAIPLMGTTFGKFREELESEEAQRNKLDELMGMLNNQKGVNVAATHDIELFLSWLGHRHEGGIDDDDEKLIYRKLHKKFVASVAGCDYKSGEGLSVLDNYIKVIQGLGRSREILPPNERMRAGIVNLFTTNYDLFHEHALERSRYAYTDGFTNGTRNVFQVSEFHRRPVDLEDRFRERLNPINPFFRLVKLHGSVNWRSNNNEVFRVPVPMGLTNENNGEALIAPTSSKYAQTQGAPYSDLFREFVNVLAERNTVLFTTGFSFADDHITKIIENALSRSDFTLVAFVGNPNRKGEKAADTRFFERTQSSNAYFIYPMQDPLGYIGFGDVAEFFGPDTLDSPTPNTPNSEDNND